MTYLHSYGGFIAQTGTFILLRNNLFLTIIYTVYAEDIINLDNDSNKITNHRTDHGRQNHIQKT